MVYIINGFDQYIQWKAYLIFQPSVAYEPYNLLFSLAPDTSKSSIVMTTLSGRKGLLTINQPWCNFYNLRTINQTVFQIHQCLQLSSVFITVLFG
jgi:hypothetical protein